MDTHYQGLTLDEVAKQLEIFGSNVLPEKKVSFFVKFFKWLLSPIALMLIAAATLSFFVDKIIDGWVILALFFINFGISFWHENKADEAIQALQKKLDLVVWVFRDKTWVQLSSKQLVPNDIIKLNVGAVIPADIILLEAYNITANESVLTGESLPNEKNIGDIIYSGSFLATGRAIGRVVATGGHTSFGKTVSFLDTTHKESTLEQDVLSISRFLGAISGIAVVVVSVSLFYNGSSFFEILRLDIGLIIAGIPIALPTVMSLILSVGVFELAKKGVVVRRLSSLEDLANVDLLLTDKTGTLTSSSINVEKVVPFNSYSNDDVLSFAISAVDNIGSGSIEEAVLRKAHELHLKRYEKKKFIPADSLRKRSTSVINIDGIDRAVSFGAPQVIQELCVFTDLGITQYEQEVAEAARLGYRTLTVAINQHGESESNMEIVGILLLSDTIYPNSKYVIEFLKNNGIDVKMLTGDSQGIGARVALELGLEGVVKRRDDINEQLLSGNFQSIAGFSEILPLDKYNIVSAERKNHVVAVTGDGVNDMPAIKGADVGIAVSNAVDALKEVADIVLFDQGLTIIRDALIEARKIFVRLYNYSVYRISESFRIILLMAIFGLFFGQYALTPVELILLALLNDVPIISMAFDRVKVPEKPSKINRRERFMLSTFFGLAGLANSLLAFWIARSIWHLDWAHIQSLFFLKLVVSGHMLIYVAHTNERWYRFLPSKQVIIATILTQIIATIMVLIGVLVERLPLSIVAFVWIWTFGWMQVSELMKILQQKIIKR